MSYYTNREPPSDYLQHWGILGMKWGQRRYQNPDGSLTPEGQRRRAERERRAAKKAERKQTKALKKAGYAAAPKTYQEITPALRRKKLNVQYLSDSDLKLLNDRLNSEDNYYKRFPKKQGIGKKFVSALADKLPSVLAQSVNKVIATAASKYGDEFIKDMFQDDSPAKDTTTDKSNDSKNNKSNKNAQTTNRQYAMDPGSSVVDSVPLNSKSSDVGADPSQVIYILDDKRRY